MNVKRTALALVLGIIIPLSLFAGGDAEASGVDYKAPIDIGTKNFTEQYIVGYLMYALLEDRGYDVDIKTGLSTSVMREGLVNGDIDLCMEYTGTGWLTHLGNEFKGESPQEMFDLIAEADAQNGIVWFEPPIWCNNTYVVVVPQEFAEANNVKTLSDFAAVVTAQGGDVSISTTNEFYARPDGIKAMEEHYGFSFNDDAVVPVQAGVQKKYLIEGNVDSTVAFGTDSEIVKYGWVAMQDDKNFWPPYDLTPVTRTEVLESNDGLEKALQELVDAFPKDPAAARGLMTELNAKVDIDKLEPEEVATEWLQEQGLID